MVDQKKILIRTLILTTIIFAIGIIVGLSMDTLRSNNALVGLRDSELDVQSYLTEQEFFETFGEYRCDVADKKLAELSKQIGELGYYIVNFERKNLFKQEDYDYLLRKYYLTELKTYTQFSKLKTQCNLNKTLILYFFDPEDSISERQGKILDILVKKNLDVSVFSINFNYKGDAFIDTLKVYYNITMTPTIVINNEKVEGFVNVEELSEKING
ncbi:hypothetical protein HYT51_01855 [Candidatus Woesearchaeota archaeon]|nr:hypothetical protein [Candidatus Woesearchaeota archaeon]